MPGGLRVAIVGGSLGGLTAGLVLRDIGCDVHIYEREGAELEARGAGIAALDDTVRYLTANEVLDLDEVCVFTDAIRYLAADGSERHDEQRRQRFTAWNTIYRTLLGCFDEDRYHLDAQVDDFSQDADGVEVRFADGVAVGFDLLVGADGMGSTVRRQLLPDVAGAYAGYVAWRGTVVEGELGGDAAKTLRDAIIYQLLDRSHVLAYPIPGAGGSLQVGSRLANYVWYRNVEQGEDLDALLTDRDGNRRALSMPPGALRPEYRDELVQVAEDQLAPPLAEVVTKADPFVQVIFDLGVPQMRFGRVCLIGDAAFAVRPHAAAGTAKAAADGWALAEALDAAGHDLDSALDDWEPRQLALGQQLLDRARDIGNRSQFAGDWEPGDPTLRFGLYEPGR